MWLPHSFIFLLLGALASAAVTNTTIDDSSSSFAFPGIFWNIITPTSPCPSCSSQADPSKTHDGTWHDGNINRTPGAPSGAVNTSGSFTFTGSAVYIFGIDQTTTQPNIVFTLGSIQQVHHYTGTEQFVYNALFFSADGLASDQTHTVNWVFNFADTSAGVQAALFDYAIVTSGEDVAETTPSGPVPSPSLTTSSKVAASHTGSPRGSTILSSGSTVLNSSSTVLSSGSTVMSSGSTVSSPIPSGFTVTLSSGLTTVTAPAGAVSKSKGAVSKSKSHLGAIIGGVIGGLAVIALGMLSVCIRLRRVRRVKSQTDPIARAQFFRIGDHPSNIHQIGTTVPISRSTFSPKRQNIAETSLAGPSTTSLLMPVMNDVPGGLSRDLRLVQERLGTLEAQVAVQQQVPPPPYINQGND